jgi:solute carrier family 50 (sugar transporter)
MRARCVEMNLFQLRLDIVARLHIPYNATLSALKTPPPASPVYEKATKIPGITRCPMYTTKVTVAYGKCLSKMLEIAAILSTVGFFMTNFIDLREFRRQKSTGRSSIIPFLAQFTNCTLWLKYGLLLNNDSIISVNIVGLIIAIISIYVFFVYTHQKDDTERKIQITLAFLVAVLLYIIVFYSEETKYQLGFVTAFFGILMFGSPLINLSRVIQTKSTVGLISLPMTAASLVVCTLWTLIGYQINDIFVILPNFAGGVLAVIQFVFILAYRKPQGGFLPVRNHVE